MKIEFEAKFLNVNFEEIRSKLKTLGFECAQPMRLMRRITIDNEIMKAKDAFLRVRDEGDKVTMTYKQFKQLAVDGAHEIEVEVSSFDETVQMLAEAGLVAKSFQESKRETWKQGSTEVVLDEWPWLSPYIEVESNSENQVKETAEKLGLKWDDAVFGDVMAAYRKQYPHLNEADTIGNIPSVKFNDPLPDLLKVSFK